VRVIEGGQSASGLRFAIVVSKYHDFVTERLQAGAMSALVKAGAGTDTVTIVKVPGAFEIPLAARQVAASGTVDAVICLGCLIRGATPHFDYIASAVSHGLIDAAAQTGVPVTFGVLTTNSVEEALERAGEGTSNKGWEAATAAIEMALVVGALARGAAAR
jgi:6,7-dimethyl-8-ribityllumazine synthase